MEQYTMRYETNEGYKDHRELMFKKYETNLKSLDKKYTMEPYLCFAILCENARAFNRGDLKEVLPGGGIVNMNELIADVRQLDQLAGVEW